MSPDSMKVLGSIPMCVVGGGNTEEYIFQRLLLVEVAVGPVVHIWILSPAQRTE